MPRRATYLTRGLIAVAAIGICALAATASPAPRAHAGGAASLPAALAQDCLPNGTVRVSFGWISGFGTQQWIDLSLADNGFVPGTFVGAGPLAGSAGSFVWDGLLPGHLHFARVNTWTGSFWAASEKSTFLTKSCAFGQPAQLAPVTAVYCDAATLQWAPSTPAGVVQWVDISLQPGFAPGTFSNIGPLAPAAGSVFTKGLNAGSTYYWRVNTWTGTGWATSWLGTFRTGCAAPATTSGGCHPSYKLECIKIGIGDYDCPGEGDGPNYPRRVLAVVGPDEFGLDSDHDGIGCE